MIEDSARDREIRSRRRRARRRRAEVRFRLLGIGALTLALGSLIGLLGIICSSGWTAFQRTKIALPVTFRPESLGLASSSSRYNLDQASPRKLFQESLDALFPGVRERRQKKLLRELFSAAAPDELLQYLREHPEAMGRQANVSLSASSDVDQIFKGNAPIDVPEEIRLLNDQQLDWYGEFFEEGRISTELNWEFFMRGDSRKAEKAGVGGAIVGSLLTLLVCVLLSFPIGVAAAIYLEEFAPKNRLTDLVEVNINNLAAVPSIIFGLLGLAVLLNQLNLPRGTPLVGGIVLALMTLPVVIISGRASLRAVPPSIRQGAMAMGASPAQVIFHHVLPLALPGMLTGTIIGLARALGETAPLLMIGMAAFVVDVPQSMTDPAAALPVQIYLWAESAERGFVEKASAAILVALCFLLVMNSVAVFLRTKFERSW